MKLIHAQQCWYGRLNPGFSDEREAITVLGTDLVQLPFTGRATEETIREYFKKRTGCYLVEAQSKPAVQDKLEDIMIRLFEGNEWLANFPWIDREVCFEFAAVLQAAGDHLITVILED